MSPYRFQRFFRSFGSFTSGKLFASSLSPQKPRLRNPGLVAMGITEFRKNSASAFRGESCVTKVAFVSCAIRWLAQLIQDRRVLYFLVARQQKDFGYYLGSFWIVIGEGKK